MNQGLLYTAAGWRKVNTIKDLRTDNYAIVNQNSRFFGQNVSCESTLRLVETRSWGESPGAKKEPKKT